MSSWAGVRISKYSKGMLQRIGLAQALMNDPELIVLDEPTDGLDPMGRRDVRELLLEFKQRGRTIFINSHLLSELEMVCDRVSILVEGMVARQGALKELTDQSKEYRITVTGDVAPVRAEIEALGCRITDGRIVIPSHDRELLNRVIDVLRSRDVLIESVEPRRFSLEDVFVEALGQMARGPGDAVSRRPFRCRSGP
jgi:ABC-2 type transport system ATP-binding protein